MKNFFCRLTDQAKRLLFPVAVSLTAVAVVANQASAAWRPLRGCLADPPSVAPNTDAPIYWLTAALTLGAALLSAAQCVHATLSPASKAK